MTRPGQWRVCNYIGPNGETCPELHQNKRGRCDTHTPAPWGDGGHQTRLGKSGWQRQRDNQRTMKLHGGRCYVCGHDGADQIDHVIPLAEGGTDDEANRRPIHAQPCHQDKTAREAARGRITGHGTSEGVGYDPYGTAQGPEQGGFSQPLQPLRGVEDGR